MNTPRLRNIVIHSLLIALVGAMVYSNSLDVPFQFDDSYNTINNPAITDLRNIPAMFAGQKGTWASRPLLMATIAVNFHFGGFETRGYHILNMVVHLVNGVLLYLLILFTSRHIGYDERKTPYVAFFSSLLFVLHPANTEAVISVVNRTMLFATTFYLTGMILFLKSVTAQRRRWLYIGGLFIASLLGMASRENFITFPLMLLVYDLLFISRFSFRAALGNWRAYLPAVLSIGYMAVLALNNTYDRVLSKGIAPLHYALTQMNVSWTYVRLLFFPLNLNVDYDYPTARTLSEIPTVISFLGYVGLWAGGIFIARRRPLVSFAMLWFVIALVPISFIVAFMGVRLGDVLFEHRIYLPGVAFFPALVAGIVHVVERARISKPLAVSVALLLVMAVGFSLVTHGRNEVWRTEVGLWEDVVSKSPNKSRPHYNLARFLSRADRDLEAMGHYQTAIRLNPNDPQAHFNIGVLYLQRGFTEDARREFETTLRIRPNDPEATKFLRYMQKQSN